MEPFIFRVTGRETFQKENPPPNVIENICDELNKTSLFVYIGKSRINGDPIFKINHNLLLRKYKIQKILNKEHIDESHVDYEAYIMDTLSMYAGDIEIVTTIEDNVNRLKNKWKNGT